MVLSLSALWARRPTLALELENKGSVARDHLAGERTFLAWLRTSLSLVSLGIAIAQLLKLPEIVDDDGQDSDGGDSTNGGEQFAPAWLGQGQGQGQGRETTMRWWLNEAGGDSTGRLSSLEKLGKPLGASCIALGALCLLMGAYRYYLVQVHLTRGSFPPSRVEISVMTLFVGALVVASFGIVVGVRLNYDG